MTTAATLVLPDALREHADKMERALKEPVLMTWDEGIKFREADQPKAIARVLINAIHTHLKSARIGYLYRPKINERDHTTLGKASRVTGKLEFFANLDFLMEINWDAWRNLQPRAKIALIDHELCHFSRNDDGAGVLVAHDVEEFSAIVTRWGLWKMDLKRFGEHVVRTTQRDLFADSAIAADIDPSIVADVAEKANGNGNGHANGKETKRGGTSRVGRVVAEIDAKGKK